MKHFIYALLLVSLFASNDVFSYTKWTTTKVALRTGNCQLESNKIKVIVHPYHIDVEEEVIITTFGNVSWGDPNTLEITGDFQLTPGSCMRSMLLWNGNKILKAKLIDRELADSIMDSIVDKTYRDPALIRYEGNNRYSFRIYPVAINNSRKLRVLYTAPLQLNNGRLQFEFQPAFTLGAQQVPTQIPVEFVKSGSNSKEYILQHGTTKKSLQFGSIYLIPFQDFHKGNAYYYYSAQPDPLIITPDTTCSMNKAYEYKLESTKASGCYTAIFATVPDELKKLILETQLSNYTLETKIITSDNSYITDIPVNSSFHIYIKSKTHWNSLIHWNVYNENGNSVIHYVQHFDPYTDPVEISILPLLWGARYTLVEGLGNLGGIFGFVDYKMSLLALEKDTLPVALAQKYANEGVPPLLAEEIFADTANLDVPPENIVIDITNPTGFTSMPKDVLDHILITIKPGNLVIIQFDNLNLKHLNIEIYDVRGKLIKRYNNVRVINRKAQLNLPATMKGVYVMRIKAGSLKVSRMLVLR